LYFASPATQNVEEAHEMLSSWSCNALVALTAESMFVPDDHVPAVYTNALPVASMATQKVSDTQETADNPCLAKWSTFTSADQAPDFAGAAVEAVLRLVPPQPSSK
jgi:hypothetical protein